MYGVKDSKTKTFKKNFKLKKNEESPFEFVMNSFERKSKLRSVYSKRSGSILGKRADFETEFWNYDDNNFGNDLLREILHYSKNYKGILEKEDLQFQNTAKYLQSNFQYRSTLLL